jgi:hypothetical protein
LGRREDARRRVGHLRADHGLADHRRRGHLRGAPFWFDFLGKVSNLRGAGKKPASVLPPPDND